MSKSKTCSFVPTNLALQCYCNFREIWQIYANLWQQQNKSEQIANGHVHITKNGQVLRWVQNTKDVHHDRPIVQAWKKAKIPWRLPGHSTVIMPIIPTLCKRLTVIPKDIPVVAITLTTPVQLAMILFALENTYKHKFSNNNMKKKQLIVKDDNLYTCIWRTHCVSHVYVNTQYIIFTIIYYIYVCICIMLLLCLKLLRELYDL